VRTRLACFFFFFIFNYLYIYIYIYIYISLYNIIVHTNNNNKYCSYILLELVYINVTLTFVVIFLNGVIQIWLNTNLDNFLLQINLYCIF